jgi:hypothetical protein
VLPVGASSACQRWSPSKIPGVGPAEHVRIDAALDDLLDLPGAWPQVGQEHGPALRVVPEGVVAQVEVHGAGQGVGDHQGRGGEVVQLHLRVDAALEVAVARQHRHHGEVVVADGRGHLLDQRTGCPDAGHTAEPGQVEAERLQRLHQPGGPQVAHDDQGPGGQGGLDPGPAAKAAAGGVPGQQAGGDHHLGVGGIGAGGDGGDGHRAVAEPVPPPL